MPRRFFGPMFLLILLSGFALRTGVAHAQKKGNDSAELAKARQRVQALERENREHEQRIKQLAQEVRERNKRIDHLEADLKKARGEDRSDDKAIADLRKQVEKLKHQVKEHETVRKADLVHAEFYRLRPTAGPEAVKAFLEGAPRALGKLGSVRAFWAGRPSARGGAGATKDYQVGFIAVFDDADGLRRFLDDAARKTFNAGLSKNWEPVVYDLLRE